MIKAGKSGGHMATSVLEGVRGANGVELRDRIKAFHSHRFSVEGYREN
jgi:hypothetical protein